MAESAEPERAAPVLASAPVVAWALKRFAEPSRSAPAPVRMPEDGLAVAELAEPAREPPVFVSAEVVSWARKRFAAPSMSAPAFASAPEVSCVTDVASWRSAAPASTA